jgi:hypothetical protein
MDHRPSAVRPFYGRTVNNAESPLKKSLSRVTAVTASSSPQFVYLKVLIFSFQGAGL